MGRVKDFRELGKKGLGKKSRKQSDPDIPEYLKAPVDAGRIKKKVGGRIKQRLRKRIIKHAAEEMVKERKKKGDSNRLSDKDDNNTREIQFIEEDLVEEAVAQYTDDNSSWLKPVSEEKNRSKEKKKKEKKNKKKNDLDSTETSNEKDGKY